MIMISKITFYICKSGEMAEWSNAVLKTVEVTPPGFESLFLHKNPCK